MTNLVLYCLLEAQHDNIGDNRLKKYYSCLQDCAEGYHRISEGPFLGHCVPCNCYGHADTCDPETGQCIVCDVAKIGVFVEH